MRTRASHSGCAATALCIFSPATGASIPLAAMGVFERHSLSNGLRVLTAPMPQAQSVSCFVMLPAGSRYETAETNGIAHFAEHMFFKGTGAGRRRARHRRRDRLDRQRVQRLHRQGVHGLLRPLRRETRDTALDVLVDMLRHSRFDPRRSSARRA